MKNDLIVRIISQTPEGKYTKEGLEEKSLGELDKILMQSHTPYTLKLHERYWDSSISMDILKVPGGWLYSLWDVALDRVYAPTFVPQKKMI